MMSTRTGVRALVMVTLCYGALEIVGLLLLLLLLFFFIKLLFIKLLLLLLLLLLMHCDACVCAVLKL